jgi:hypothetical protein
MKAIGCMKSQMQPLADDTFQQRQEMRVSLEQEGIVIPGDFGNSEPFMPIGDFSEDVFRPSAPERGL